MICPNCGKEVDVNSKFCGFCGTPINVGTAKEETEKPVPPKVNVKTASPHNPTPGKKPIALIAAAAVIVVLAVFFLGSSLLKDGKNKKININDYVSVTFSGYDSYGTAEIVFDSDSFYEDYEDLSWDEEGLREFAEEQAYAYFGNADEITDEEIDAVVALLEAYDPADIVYEEFLYSLSLDISSGLSNGDTVTLTWDINEENLEQMSAALGREFTYSDKEFTVKDLAELETYDPFELISVSFEGTAPDGHASVQITGSGEIASSLSVSLDVSDGLSNGDTVTVTVNTAEDAFAENMGVILSPLEMEYTADGLAYYISSTEDIPDTDLERMKEEVNDAFTSYIAGDWEDTVTLLGFDYIGSWLLSSKSGSGNLFYLVYQVNAEIFEELTTGFSDQLITCYYYAVYDGLLMTSDGELNVDYLDFDTVSNWITPYSNYAFLGYEDLDVMYKALVTERAASYTCENLVTDADFGYEATLINEVYGIPDDAYEYNGHYYKAYNIGTWGMTWEQAKEQCELRGGHLVTITSEEEMNMLSIGVMTDSAHYWCGLYYDIDAAWKWVTGEEMEYATWANDPDSGEASSYPYVCIRSGSGWAFVNATGSNNWASSPSVWGYVCEWDSDTLE